MNVVINGTAMEAPDGLTIRQLLDLAGIIEKQVAVELNKEIVPRARHHEHRVQNGDVLEVVHFVGGG